MARAGGKERPRAWSYEHWWWRLGPRGRRAVVIGAVLVFLVAYGPLLVRPLVSAYRAADKVLLLERERDELIAEGQELSWRLEQATKPEGQRREGKALDLFPKGERILELDDPAVEAALRQATTSQSGLAGRAQAVRSAAAAKAHHAGDVLSRLVSDPSAARTTDQP